MNKRIALIVIIFMMSCSPRHETKIPCYAWLGGPGKATDKELKAKFTDLKKKGIDGLMYSAGQDPETYRRVGKIVKRSGHGVSCLDTHAHPKKSSQTETGVVCGERPR